MFKLGDKIVDMRHFHAHIYFEPNRLESARLLSERAELSGLFGFVQLRGQPVGPHPTGMIEAHFRESAHASVLVWLEANRGDFSVLVHEDSGDDFRDHTDGARWLGEGLPLKFDFFALIQENPELRVHKPAAPARAGLKTK